MWKLSKGNMPRMSRVHPVQIVVVARGRHRENTVRIGGQQQVRVGSSRHSGRDSSCTGTIAGQCICIGAGMAFFDFLTDIERYAEDARSVARLNERYRMLIRPLRAEISRGPGA